MEIGVAIGYITDEFGIYGVAHCNCSPQRAQELADRQLVIV
jgi:hypothetical protein